MKLKYFKPFLGLLSIGVSTGVLAAQSNTRPVPSLPDARDYRGVLMDVNCPAIAIGSKETGISKSSLPAAAATAPASEPGPAPPSGVLNTVTGGVAPPRPTRNGSDRMMVNSEGVTVDQKYGDCMVKSSTSAFALLEGEKLLVLDDGSNSKIRDRMNSAEWKGIVMDASGKPKWTNITFFGAMRNGQLSIDPSVK